VLANQLGGKYRKIIKLNKRILWFSMAVGGGGGGKEGEKIFYYILTPFRCIVRKGKEKSTRECCEKWKYFSAGGRVGKGGLAVSILKMPLVLNEGGGGEKRG